MIRILIADFTILNVTMIAQIQPCAWCASALSNPCSCTANQHSPADGGGQEVQAKLLALDLLHCMELKSMDSPFAFRSCGGIAILALFSTNYFPVIPYVYMYLFLQAL